LEVEVEVALEAEDKPWAVAHQIAWEVLVKT